MKKKTTTQDMISKTIASFSNYDYKLTNTFMFIWESDFFAISQSGYVIEIEIKITRSDFLADFSKTAYKDVLKHDYLKDKNETWKPNKFAYACPEGIISPDELPLEYGLYYPGPTLGGLKNIKPEKFLHKRKLLKEYNFVYGLMKKFYYRQIDLRQANELRLSDIKFGQGRLPKHYY